MNTIHLLENSSFFFFLIDSVEDDEKLVKTVVLEAFGRIGTVA